MAGFRYVSISGSVGLNGLNRHVDISAVQDLINVHLPVSLQSLHVDGICGPLTIAGIQEVERQFGGVHHPDGRIDPHGPTLHALNHVRRPRPLTYPLADPPARILAVVAPAIATRSVAAGQSLLHAKPSGTAGTHGIPVGIIAAAQAAQKKWKVPASVSIAQWVLESGMGKHMPPGSNNPFGIKAAKGQPSVTVMTREETSDGRSIQIKAPFRKFDSMAQAFDEHGRLLATHPAYVLARLRVKDPDAYADALTHHYATDSHYGSLLKAIMKSRELYQYNEPARLSA